MPSSTLTTYRSQYFKFYVGRSWVVGCVLPGVNIHQEATYVCIGDHQLWNNSVLPSLSPARLPCDKAEMEVCCRSEWGCNYFLTSLSASKPSHSALQLMRCPCGIVMLSKWMPLWQPRALWAADYCRVSPNNTQPSSCRSIHYKAYMTQPLLAALVWVKPRARLHPLKWPNHKLNVKCHLKVVHLDRECVIKSCDGHCRFVRFVSELFFTVNFYSPLLLVMSF